MDSYDIEENETEYKEEEITGKVSKTLNIELSYPYVEMDILKLGKERYKMKFLLSMVSSSHMYKEADMMQGVESKMIHLYVEHNGNLMELGNLHTKQMKNFIDLVGLDTLHGKLDADTRLNGSYLYVLCS